MSPPTPKAPADPDEARWRAALDAFRGGIVVAGEQLTAGDRTVDPSRWPPPDLPVGPPPPALQAEARGLLREADELTRRLTDAMAECAPPERRPGGRSTGVRRADTSHARWSFDL